jgi:hypothetical protein
MNRIKDLTLLAIALGLVIGISMANKFTPSQVPAPTSQSRSLDIGIHFDSSEGKIQEGWYWYLYEGERGSLCYKNTCLLGHDTNDYYVTPWGKCFWHNNTIGWQFEAAAGRLGKELKPQNLKGIDISRAYIMGPWRYAVTHLVPPGHRYHLEGRLYYHGQEVQEPTQFNDYITTPWGNLYWVGWTQATRYGSRGWIRVPDPRYPPGTNVTPTYLKGQE